MFPCRRTILTVTGLLLILPTLSLAQGWHGRQGHRGFREHPGPGRLLNHPEVAERLGLTSEQQEALHRVFRRQAERYIERRAEEQRTRLDLSGLLRADAPDRAAVEALLRREAEQRITAILAGLDDRQEIAGILTAGQQSTLRDLVRRIRVRQGARHTTPRPGRFEGGPRVPPSWPPPAEAP